MTKITRFEDLNCWQEAVELATQIYQVSNEGDLSRDFGFRDQLRRAAISIASNIAEGKERETVNEFVRFLYIAKGSAGEVRTQLHIARRIGYLSNKTAQELEEAVERISGMIANLIRSLKGRSR